MPSLYQSRRNGAFKAAGHVCRVLHPPYEAQNHTVASTVATLLQRKSGRLLRVLSGSILGVILKFLWLSVLCKSLNWNFMVGVICDGGGKECRRERMQRKPYLSRPPAGFFSWTFPSFKV